MPGSADRLVSVVPVDPSLAHLARAFVYSVPEGMNAPPGSLVRVRFRGRRRLGIVIAPVGHTEVERILPIAEVIGDGLPPDLLELCVWTSERYLATPGEALAAALPARVAAEEGAIFSAAPAVRRRSLAWASRYRGGAGLVQAVERGGGAFLWRPLAGEPKGEAIASLIAAALARGRGACVLLPEVRFAGDTAAAIAKAAGDAAVWVGSERSARERYRAWLALRSGARRLAVGGRGAIFAPVRNLGLVVVDDEGHHSYKERRAPRFHARTVAAERARRTGATLVLIGSPPSIEAREAAERGSLATVVAPRAEEMRRRPPVSVIDLSRAEERHVPSARTLALARSALEQGRRVVLLVHRSGEEMRAIAARVSRALPARSPARLDARSGAAAVARAVAEADLLVATPVIAKDVAPTGVGLVAILEADAALTSPNFRAAEEAFATWWHVGRWARAGTVAIETAQPRHPAVVALSRWDSDVLYRAEAARRRELRYPPFGALARVETQTERAGRVAAEIAKAMPGGEVLGPIQDGEEAVIVARAPTRAVLLGALGPLAAGWRETGDPVRIDVDPLEVLP